MISCLLIIKCLIFESSATANRVIVTKDTFNKSIYFLLLRGIKKPDNSHINFTNLVSDLILKSGKLIIKTQQQAKPNLKIQKLDSSEWAQRVLQGHLTNLSISCMVDICFFVQEQGRKQVLVDQKAKDNGSKNSKKRLNESSVDQLIEEVKQEEAKEGQL